MSIQLQLFDGAQITKEEPLWQHIQRWLEQGKALDIYANQARELHGLGPLLCDVTPKEVLTSMELKSGASGQEGATCWSGVDLRPGETMSSLAARWERSCIIECDDAMRYYLRFADVRVLSVLPRVMNAAQWMLLTGALENWHFMDRQGKTQTWRMSQMKDIASGQNTVWTDDQINALTDMTWPDALLAEVQSVIPQWRPGDSMAQKHAVACAVYEKAHSCGKADDLRWQIQACIDGVEA